MYRSIVLLAMSLGLAPLVTGESRGPIGPKLCVELCNQKGNCKAAFYDSQNLVCHFEEPKSSGGKEHITQLMARPVEKEQNGVLIQTRNKGLQIVPATRGQPSGHACVLTNKELANKGYRKIYPNSRLWLKAYGKSQTWFDALACCRADGATLVKAQDMRTRSRISSAVAGGDFIWVGLSYSQRRGKFLWMDGTPGNQLKTAGHTKDGCGAIGEYEIRVLVKDCNALYPFVCGLSTSE